MEVTYTWNRRSLWKLHIPGIGDLCGTHIISGIGDCGTHIIPGIGDCGTHIIPRIGDCGTHIIPGIGDLPAGEANTPAEDAGLVVVKEVAIYQHPVTIQLDLCTSHVRALGVQSELDGVCNSYTKLGLRLAGFVHAEGPGTFWCCCCCLCVL